jgi:hypothetical protein
MEQKACRVVASSRHPFCCAKARRRRQQVRLPAVGLVLLLGLLSLGPVGSWSPSVTIIRSGRTTRQPSCTNDRTRRTISFRAVTSELPNADEDRLDAPQATTTVKKATKKKKKGEGLKGAKRGTQTVQNASPPDASTPGESLLLKSTETPTRKKRKKKKTSSEPLHWTHPSDTLALLVNSTEMTELLLLGEAPVASALLEEDPVSLCLTVRGNPLPLRRHRTSRGFVYNPSAAAQASFRSHVNELVFGTRLVEHEPNSSACSLPPLFAAETSLAVTLILRLKRPLSHFRASKREAARLKANAPPALTSTTRTDADNLAKFVLDACNGLLYEDDRQIQTLHVIKQLDNHDTCLGSTQLLVRCIDESMEGDILQHAIGPYGPYLGQAGERGT